MFKFLFCLLILKQAYSQDPLSNILNAKSCPSYSVMPGLDMKKVGTTWYDIATTDSFFADKRCSKNTLFTSPDGTLQLNNSLILKADNSQINIIFKYKMDPNEPGTFLFNQTVRDRSIFGDEDREVEVRLSTIYTDYNNIIVFYQCWNERNNMIVRKVDQVYILAQDRKFDSLTMFARAMASIENLDIDSNRLMFVYNGPNCTN